jgi:hypothetical protein
MHRSSDRIPGGLRPYPLKQDQGSAQIHAAIGQGFRCERLERLIKKDDVVGLLSITARRKTLGKTRWSLPSGVTRQDPHSELFVSVAPVVGAVLPPTILSHVPAGT